MLGRVQISSGSGLVSGQSSGSGFIGFGYLSKVRVWVLAFGFIGFHRFEITTKITF